MVEWGLLWLLHLGPACPWPNTVLGRTSPANWGTGFRWISSLCLRSEVKKLTAVMEGKGERSPMCSQTHRRPCQGSCASRGKQSHLWSHSEVSCPSSRGVWLTAAWGPAALISVSPSFANLTNKCLYTCTYHELLIAWTLFKCFSCMYAMYVCEPCVCVCGACRGQRGRWMP